MKSIIACAIVAVFLCSCQQIQDIMKPKPKAEPAPAESSSPKSGSTSSTSSSSGAKYDPVTSLKAFVPYNVMKFGLVDPSKAAVGSMAEQDMGNKSMRAVAIVGEMNGNKIVELTASYMKDYASNKPAVISVEVDGTGKVLKAWGGLVGMEGVALAVPPTPKPVVTKEGEKMEVKEEDLAAVTVLGMKGMGKKYTTKHGSSSSWKNDSFPFFGGILKTEAGPSKMVLSKYEKSGAKAQLKIK
jgi:hypothetical protein